MGHTIYISGQKFGRWTALIKTRKRNSSGACMWLCECDCGNISHVGVNALKSGQSFSCGCYRDDQNTKLRIGKSNLSARKSTGF